MGLEIIYDKGLLLDAAFFLQITDRDQAVMKKDLQRLFGKRN